MCEGEIEKLHKVRFYLLHKRDCHYYAKEGHLSVNELPKVTKSKQNRVITKAQIDELRNWRAEYGQRVRQATVRSQTTKDKPGTLPMICYKFKPDEPQHVDFGNLKALRISKEKSAQPDKQRSIIYRKGAVAVVKKSAVRGTQSFLNLTSLDLKKISIIWNPKQKCYCSHRIHFHPFSFWQLTNF